jgi:hypothetical protein
MLSDREKFIAHYLSVIMVGIFDGKKDDHDSVTKTINKLRKARARNLSSDDVDELIKDLNEEFLLAGSYLNLEHKYREDDEMK